MWNIKSEVGGMDRRVVHGNYRWQLFTSCDSRYFKLYASSFLASVNRNSPGATVLIEVINPDDGFDFELCSLRQRLRAIEIVAFKTRASFQFCTEEETRTFYACRRFVTLHEILRSDPTPTFSLDVDSLVRKDLLPLFDQYDGVDVGIFLRPDRRAVSRKVLSGGLYIDPRSAGAQTFLEKLSEKIRYAPATWYLDQESISILLADMAHVLKVADLKKDYLDFDFADQSTVWTGKGDRKNSEMIYLKYGKFVTDAVTKTSPTAIVVPASSDQLQSVLSSHSAVINVLAFEGFGIPCEVVYLRRPDLNESELAALPHNRIYAPPLLAVHLSDRIQPLPYWATSTEDLQQAMISVSLGEKVIQIENPNIEGYRAVVNRFRAPLVESAILALDSHALFPEKKPKKTLVTKVVARGREQMVDLFVRRLEKSTLRGKTIAIVGNANSILRGNWGSEIDQHDLVFRFNLGYPLTLRKELESGGVNASLVQRTFLDARTFPPEKHTLLVSTLGNVDVSKLTNVACTGRRTTHWVCATVDQERQRVYSEVFEECIRVWPHPTTYGNINKTLLNGRLRTIDKQHYIKFKNLDITPSSGLIIVDFLQSIPELAGLSLYGFDFFKSGHQTRRNTLLLQKTGKFPHSGEHEANYILDLEKKDKRIRIRK